MTGGVVRRDGLREAVTKARAALAALAEDTGEACKSNPCSVCTLAEATQLLAARVARVLDAVPDVPPTEDVRWVLGPEGVALCMECDPPTKHASVGEYRSHAVAHRVERLMPTRRTPDHPRRRDLIEFMREAFAESEESGVPIGWVWLADKAIAILADVPPDQPAVDLAGRDGSSFVTADDLHDAFCEFGHQCQMHDLCQAREGARHVADALNLRAADVRASALEDAADAAEQDINLGNGTAWWLRDRAVSEREGDGS